MHDKVGMCLLYSAQGIDKEQDARLGIKLVFGAIAVNVVALNVLQYKKRLPVYRHSRVNEFGDVGMLQPAQNAPFALEPLFATLPHQRDIENLHRYAPFKSSVVSFRQPDGAHSPVADLRYQGVNTQSLACQARPARQFQSARLQKTFLRQQAVLAKQYFKLIGQGWVLVLERGQPDRALVVCHLQRFVKVWTKNLPLIGAELGHL